VSDSGIPVVEADGKLHRTDGSISDVRRYRAARTSRKVKKELDERRRELNKVLKDTKQTKDRTVGCLQYRVRPGIFTKQDTL